MMLAQFRARYFNPEKWFATGFVLALLTSSLLVVYDLISKGAVPTETAIAVGILVVVGTPFFGLLFRLISRRALTRAR